MKGGGSRTPIYDYYETRVNFSRNWIRNSQIQYNGINPFIISIPRVYVHMCICKSKRRGENKQALVVFFFKLFQNEKKKIIRDKSSAKSYSLPQLLYATTCVLIAFSLCLYFVFSLLVSSLIFGINTAIALCFYARLSIKWVSECYPLSSIFVYG